MVNEEVGEDEEAWDRGRRVKVCPTLGLGTSPRHGPALID